MKKIITGIGIVALSTALFACGGNGKKELNDAYDYKTEIANHAKLDANTETTVDFWHTWGDDNQKVLNDAIVEFNKIYPKIKITHSAQGGYEDINKNIKTAISAGTTPDIAMGYPDHFADYLGDNYDASVVFNLSALIKDEDFGIAEGTYVDSYMEEGKSYGTDSYYSMPVTKATEAIFYNKTFFDANNLTPPKTWDEFETLAAKVKEIDPTKIALGYDSDDNLFINSANQYGYDYTDASKSNPYTFNNDNMKGLVQKYTDWADSKWITTKSMLDGAYTSGEFLKQNIVMSIGSTGGTKFNIPENGEFEVGVAAVPQVTTDLSKGKVMSQGPSMVFFEDEKGDLTKTLAAWEFYKFFTNEENNAKFALASTGYSPVNKATYENAEYKAFINATGGSAVDKALRDVANLVENTYIKNNMFASSDVFRGSSAARAQMSSIMKNAMTKDKTVEEAFKEAYNILNFK